MPRQRLPRLCSNLKCQTVETPLWRRGWKKSDGTFARLCNSCGLHFRKGHYCDHCMQLYKEQDNFDDSWISCSSCGRYGHKSCIKAARGEAALEDFLCLECAPTSDCDVVVDSETEETKTEITTLRKRKVSVTMIEIPGSPAKRTRKQTADKLKTRDFIKKEQSASSLEGIPIADEKYAPKRSTTMRTTCTKTVVITRRKSVTSSSKSQPSAVFKLNLGDQVKDQAQGLLRKAAFPSDPSLSGFNTLWAVCEAELSQLRTETAPSL